VIDQSSPDQTRRSIRRLSVAVWVLAIVAFANLAVSVWVLFSPALLATRIMAALPQKLMPPSEQEKIEEFNSFHDWPPEKQIQTASVIAIGRWEKSGSTLKCIITEILKQGPNTKFYYKIGDEYRLGSRPVRDDNTDYGEEEIMFFTGSPASFRFAMSFKGDRLTGMGDMPIAELRDLIRKSPP
jgi:hypothetical protein